ncbi:hypothetical protein PI124_g13373 [Phytophthora idaei]|nr:hypothetical protein PI125_g20174 [Phytophthora idaei]KAG3128660.1 hypothetical protein PI126_g21305 [Phytophthora idaei]KAG3241750.1 hypothetical protein PI124_g13373 [Phytophthora idaei]
MSFTRVSCRFTVISRHCMTFINVAAASGAPDSPTLLPTSPFDAVVIVGCTDTFVPVLAVGPAPVAEARVVTSVEYSMLPQELGPQRPPVILLSLQELGPQNLPRLSQSSKAVPKVLPLLPDSVLVPSVILASLKVVQEQVLCPSLLRPSSFPSRLSLLRPSSFQSRSSQALLSPPLPSPCRLRSP